MEQDRTVYVNERNQTKTKKKTEKSHITFKLTTRSIVRFSPQTVQ